MAVSFSSESSSVDPVKASTLLSLEGTKPESWAPNHARPNTGRQGLRIAGLSDRFMSVWAGGKVVGIGTAGLDEEDVGQEKNSLTLHLVAAALLRNDVGRRFNNRQIPPRTSAVDTLPPPIVYAVVPHTYQTIPLLHALLAEEISDSAAAVELLKDVRLLQFFDFAGLVEAVAEVSEGIFRRASDNNQERLGESIRDIVLIQGLGHAISIIHRRSGLVQANALLASLARNITQVSRMSQDVLVLVETTVETSLRDSGDTRHDVIKSKRYIAGMELDSAFASPNGECLRVVCGNETLSKTLNAAYDTMVVVHDGFGRLGGGARGQHRPHRRIVEIVKDRVGDMTGCWEIWSLHSR